MQHRPRRLWLALDEDGMLLEYSYTLEDEEVEDGKDEEIMTNKDTLFDVHADIFGEIQLKNYKAKAVYMEMLLPRPDRYGMPDEPYNFAREVLDNHGLNHSHLRDYKDVYVGVGGHDNYEITIRVSIPKEFVDAFKKDAQANGWLFEEVNDR